MLVLDQPRLQANRYVITARWFLIFGLFAVGLLTKFGVAASTFPRESLVILFLGSLVLNIFLWLLAQLIDESGSRLGVSVLSYLQIISDLMLITLLLYLIGGVFSIIPVLYFVPIVESVLIFSPFAPAVTAVMSGALMLVWASVQDYQSSTQSDGLVPSIGRAFSLTIVYIVIGVFASFIAKLLRQRGDHFAAEANLKRTEVDSLQKLNQELGKKTKALEAKELELTLANKRLESLEQAKSKFVAVTTHQLRTPLAAIKWTFNMLAGGDLGQVSDEQRKFIDQGAISTEKMISIVNDLLNIDKIETASSDSLMAPVDMRELLENILFEFATQTESKKIKLTFDKPQKDLPLIEADRAKITMLLENLIDNAIKYTPNGGSVTVTLDDARLNASQPMLEIKVADTGVGIKPDDQKNIFDKFYRAPNAVSMEPDGSGLGLFISKDIIKQHGGAIWFESEPGRRTIFHVTLPLKQQAV